MVTNESIYRAGITLHRMFQPLPRAVYWILDHCQDCWRPEQTRASGFQWPPLPRRVPNTRRVQVIMTYHEFDPERHFREIWESVSIVRNVPYSLFTFGESDLPYYLVIDSAEEREQVAVTRGNVTVTRPMIVTPDTARPEFQNFFEEQEFSEMVEFLMARTAAFSNLKMVNHRQSSELVSDSVEEVVSKLNRQLDDEEEDRIAILAAPHGLGGIAVLKYTTERIMESAPGNIQELRERGFLPE